MLEQTETKYSVNYVSAYNRGLKIPNTRHVIPIGMENTVSSSVETRAKRGPKSCLSGADAVNLRVEAACLGEASRPRSKRLA